MDILGEKCRKNIFLCVEMKHYVILERIMLFFGTIISVFKRRDMDSRIESFLASIKALHELEAKNLPRDVIEAMAEMPPEELYKVCTQFVVLKENVPSSDKMITLSEEEIQTLVEEYAKELLKRFRG